MIKSLRKKQNVTKTASNEEKNSSEEEMESSNGCDNENSQSSTLLERNKQRKRAKPVGVIGCMQCLKDTNHTKVPHIQYLASTILYIVCARVKYLSLSVCGSEMCFIVSDGTLHNVLSVLEVSQ